MRLFRFLVSGVFWLNLLLIIAFIAMLIWGSLFYLEKYTQHGKSVLVPDVHGLNIKETSQVLNESNLSYEITDSIYSDDFPRGTVVLQNPSPDKKVKRTRVVFLTVNSNKPEMVQMPDLVGKSRRIALALLEISGLQLDELEYKPDELCTDCVLEQIYKGQEISANEKIRKGEKITLILGKETYTNTEVPSLEGLSYTEAVELLNSYSLNSGLILGCKDCNTKEDSLRAYVVQQVPSENSKINLGSHVDLYLSLDPADIKSGINSSDSIN